MAEKTTNSKETLESSVTRVEDSIHIDPTKVSCSIYVTGFQATTKPDDLIIHFQRKRNGGGDIDSITVNKRGAAVITFDDPEVVKSVLQKKQEIEGMVLTVKQYEQTMRKEDHNYEAFELVSAELCLETVEVLTREQTRILLKEIADKTGINWIEVSENFVMSGAFKQVEMSRIYLQQAINQSGGIPVFTAGLKGKQLHPQKGEENKSLFYGEEDEEDLNQTSSRVNALRNEEESHEEDLHQASSRVNALRNEEECHEEEPNETQSNHFASVYPPEMQYFEVEPKFIKVFAKAHKSEIDEIEAKYLVKIPTETKSGKISLKPNDGCSTEEYNEACDLFIGLYQQMTQVMKMERFSLKYEKNVVPARKKIHEMSKRIPVLVELEKDQKHWCLYGEEQHLNDALKFLEKEKVEIKRESKHGNRTEGFAEPRDHEEAMEVDPSDSSKGGRSNDLLETYIGKVKVSVYQGDLTRERVDVVVNAANNRLRHDGGVAKAILDRGGKSIEKESNKIIRECGPLRDGEVAITNAGKLPCKKVIHAVGPDCRNVGLFHSKKVLHQACMNSFKKLEEWKMTSIALPAIGSGIYDMPKDECAQVMFDAVDEFVRQGNPKKKTITDIRFVNIDDPSVQAFRKEFISRYGHIQESEMMGSGRDIKRPPAGAEGASYSVMSPSRPDRGKNKSKNPFDNDRTTANPSSQHYNTSFFCSAAGMDHPLSGSNNPFSQNASYSGAVKNNQGGTITRSPTGHEPTGGGKTGFSLPSGATTYRKDGDSASGAGSKAECPICLDTVTNARALKCKHVFCSDCVETALKHDNRCPVCKEPQGVIQGNQPKGTMYFHKSHQRLPGYHDSGTITINYSFPSGIQGQEHPNPGQRYDGTQRTAYLPDNREGNEVLQLLRRAFEARLIFTVGTSVTSGMQNQVTWNDIHHKTNVYGGPQGFGYPDSDYLRRVKEDLAAKGIR